MVKEAIKGDIIEIGPNKYEIIEVDSDRYPRLKGDLIRRGFDGNVYKLKRILQGRQRKAWFALAYRGKNGIFTTVAGGHL